VLKAYKYQLDLNKKQKDFFAKSFGCCRWVYNWALNKKNEQYQKNKESLSAIDLIKELTIIKKQEEMQWLGEVDSQSLQQSIRNMESAFTRFFREKKGFPKFKSKNNKQSCKFTQAVIVDFEKKKIRIPKIGWIRIFIDRKFEGKIGTVTVSKNPAGKYFVSVLVDNEKSLPKRKTIKEKTTVGIDVGIKNFATLSTGEKIDNPKHLEKSLQRLVVLQRRLSKKEKGSKRYEQARLAVAKLHYKITNQRKDFLHKLTARIVAENQGVVIEDLNVEGMMKNHLLARYIQSVSWSEFFRQLQYKCEWNGKNLITIGRFEPSSKLCSCGEINHKLTLNDREWICEKCGTKHDRDVLAANNIKKFGIQNQNLIGIEKNSGRATAGEGVEILLIDGSKKRQVASRNIA
jgi:putative transposase